MLKVPSPFLATVVLLSGLVSVSNAQVSGVTCLPSFNWARNSRGQNPCEVASYLEATCNDGSFTINPLPAGYHYIGPTNDTTTQNNCICSTPVYQLMSACGACQNETWITWPSWSFFCDNNFVAPGTYSETIPNGTSVPQWAFIDPTQNNNTFNPLLAQRVGDFPESSRPPSPTSTSTSTTPTTTSISTPTNSPTSALTSSGSATSSSPSPTITGSGGGGTNTGAIAGGVVGGVVGLALIALLGVFLFKRRSGGLNGGGTLGSNPESGEAGDASLATGAVAGHSNNSSSPTGAFPEMGSLHTGPSAYYNPNDPSTFPTGGYPVSPATDYSQPSYFSPGVPQPQPVPSGRYSGAPEF